jgi:hypothetical protein
MEAAIAEMTERLTERFPSTTFEIYEGEDPDGIYLAAIIDTDDPEEATDLFRDRIVDLQVEESLPLFVIPERTPERTAVLLAREAQDRVPLLHS